MWSADEPCLQRSQKTFEIDPSKLVFIFHENSNFQNCSRLNKKKQTMKAKSEKNNEFGVPCRFVSLPFGRLAIWTTCHFAVLPFDQLSL